jgi:hypothetical protein
VDPKASLDVVAKTKIPTPAGNRTPALQPIVSSLYCLSYQCNVMKSNVATLPVGLERYKKWSTDFKGEHKLQISKSKCSGKY